MQTAGVGKERVYLDDIICLHSGLFVEHTAMEFLHNSAKVSSKCTLFTNAREVDSYVMFHGMPMFFKMHKLALWHQNVCNLSSINTVDYLNQPFISPRPWSVGRPTLEVSACVCATNSGVHQRSSCPCRSIMTQVPWSRLA